MINVLLIGYGSIGKRHFKILCSLAKITLVHVVTRQQINGVPSYPQLDALNKEQLEKYDVFLICTETNKHAEQLKYIDERVKGKLIIVEKPLFSVSMLYTPLNRVLVAYNLRFHPVIQQLKRLLADEKILTYNVLVGQYLPSWRPEQDYRQSYSSDINRGGGVLRDLSHEIDYTMMFCGELNVVGAISSKVSNLDINADDVCLLLCRSGGGAIVSLHLDYLAFQPKRSIDIQTHAMTISADLINNKMSVYTNNDKVLYDFSDYDQDYSYNQMHINAIEQSADEMCSYQEANQIMSLIDQITNNYMDI